MEQDITFYFSQVPDPRVVGRCSHLLSDILLIAICTYLTGGEDYQDMHMFAKERGSSLSELLLLPNGAPSADTFERVFQRIEPKSLQNCFSLQHSIRRRVVFRMLRRYLSVWHD